MRRFSPIIFDALGLPIGGYGLVAGKRHLSPTTGRRILSGTGKRLIGSTACCCTTYIRAKRCSDDTYADYWAIKYTSPMPTLTFIPPGEQECFYVTEGNTEDPNPPVGDRIGIGTVYVDDCDADGCKWVQARKCADGTDVDLWFPPGTTLPLHFTKTGVAYYVNSACNFSATPGTHAAGYVVTAGCPSGCCSNSTAAVPPSVLLTVSGLVRCPSVPGNTRDDDCLPFDAGNGTSSVPFWKTDGSTCYYCDNPAGFLGCAPFRYVELTGDSTSVAVLVQVIPGFHSPDGPGTCEACQGTASDGYLIGAGGCSGSVTGAPIIITCVTPRDSDSTGASITVAW